MNAILIFLAIGAGVAAVALCTPGLRRRTSVGEAMSVGMTGAVFCGLVAVNMDGHNLSEPVTAMCCSASAIGAATLLGMTLSAGNRRSDTHQENR